MFFTLNRFKLSMYLMKRAHLSSSFSFNLCEFYKMELMPFYTTKNLNTTKLCNRLDQKILNY